MECSIVRARRVSPSLEMAPMIDIVFLLLIFYMVSSSFNVPEAMEISLPESDASQRHVPEAIRVVLQDDGGVTLDGRLLGLPDLEDGLRIRIQLSGDESVTLDADSSASVQQMLDVMDAIKRAGGEKLHVTTRRRN